MSSKTKTRLEPIDYACERLNETPTRIYNLIRRGTIPAGPVVRLGRRIRINVEALEKFIADGGAARPAKRAAESQR